LFQVIRRVFVTGITIGMENSDLTMDEALVWQGFLSGLMAEDMLKKILSFIFNRFVVIRSP